MKTRVLACVALCVGVAACANRQSLNRTGLTAEEHVTLAKAYEQQKLRDLASREYQAALDMNPQNIDALIALGNIRFEEGSYGKSESLFKRVLKVSPRNASAINNLAMISIQKGVNLEKAEKRLKEILFESGALRPYLLDTLARIYLMQKRYADAERALDEAAQSAPSGDSDFLTTLEGTRERLQSSRSVSASK